MRAILLSMMVCLVGAMAGALAASEPASYQDHMTKAGEAFDAEDWSALNQHLDAAQAIRPYSLYVWKNRILALLLEGRTAEALELASTVAQRGLSMNLSGQEAFDALNVHPDFAPIAELMAANLAPIGDDVTHALYVDTGLLPEAYATGHNRKEYIGSVRTGKIIDLYEALDLDGIAVAPGGVFDIEVRGKRLWAAVNNQLAYENAAAEDAFAAIMIFDLKTGATIRDVRVSQPDALLGDLEVAKDGTAYASDSLTPRIFKLEKKSDTIDILAEDRRFANLQGITLDQKNHRLFAADYLTGLFIVDTKTGAVSAIENTIDAHLGGIDGLYLYKGDLIGIQNGTTPQRIVRIRLSADAREAIGLDVLAQNLGYWNEPTHGAIINDRLNYIATSNWPSYDADWKLRDGAEPQPVRIMTVDLE